MQGVLYVVQIKEVEGYPVILLRLNGVDPAGNERDTIFEFELPLNFKFDTRLNPNFSAFSLLKGEYVGFYFSKIADKTVFDGTIQALQQQLSLSAAQV